MKIGVFFGSRSPEHDVSIITAQLIISGLKKLNYEVFPVYISKNGQWFAGEEFGNIDFFKERDFEEDIKSLKFSLDLTSQNKIILKKDSLFGGKKLEIDLAFPAFHGQNGEDGTIQGLFELLNVPYVGCDVASSAITIDKVLTKLMYENFNIPTSKFHYFTSYDWSLSKESILERIETELKYPIFVKPARLGSSIGITKVKSKEDLEFAIEVALHYDQKVLVEEGIQNLKDLTIAVIGNNDLITSEIQESSFSNEFFSYEEKYINEGGAQLGNAEKRIIIPAQIESELTEKIKVSAKEIYKIMGCSGIARIDYLYDTSTKEFYANEVNTLPGTLYHHLWKESGINFSSLLSKLIEYAEERYDKKQRLSFTFESEILKKSNSKKFGSKLAE